MTIVLPPKLRERQRTQIMARNAQWQAILKRRREDEERAKKDVGKGNTDEDTSSPRPLQMTPLLDGDIPVTGPDDLSFGLGGVNFIVSQEPEYFDEFESACRDGPLSFVQFVISEPRSPLFLHHGLELALSNGNLEAAGALLDAGAPLVRSTPASIAQAPPEKQLSLFVLLARHGWTPNTMVHPRMTMLASIVGNIPVLRWFLAHGADPNLGHNPVRLPGPLPPVTESCAALHAAVITRNLEAVRILLDAGAEIRYGTPLHLAAGMRPPDMASGAVCRCPSKEFDKSMIPIMALLVERGADVNKKLKAGYRVPGFAIQSAARERMVERVRWLLEHGANPELPGAYGSAVEMAQKYQNAELKKVVEDGVAARRWIKGTAPGLSQDKMPE